MITKTFKLFAILIMLVILFVDADAAKAWEGCGSTYTVQSGDTLSGIAVKCNTTMAALWLANPGLGSWVYTGQVLVMPGAAWDTGSGSSIYIVAHGDTLKNIASRYGTTMQAIANLNGIYNYDMIYAGQRLTIPTGGYFPPAPPVVQPPVYGSTYIIQRGDTLRKLAYRWGVSVNQILAANPQVTNSNVIYSGQVIYIPGAGTTSNPGYYTVQAGDTLQIIANKYNTTVYNLQLLNPQIWNPNWIYSGMTLRIR